MIALAEIFSAHWILFLAAVLFFLALDLGVFHRHAHIVRFREAFTWTMLWFACAMLFAWVIAPTMINDWGRNQTDEFVTGYILELSLSMDNVFVIALIFSYFQVPQEHQHRVLFWGIFGALVMRGIMIWAGIALVSRFAWMFYVLGVFLVLTAIKMVFSGEGEVRPERNLAIRLARKLFPVSARFDGQRFFTQIEGRRALTPLALVLLMVETTDLIFAVDSIPAIFGVTQNPYIVFTSNVFAILGLRSLYFVLAGAIEYFRYLKIGLAVVLGFIGAKMLLAHTQYQVDTKLSLWIVAGIIGLSILASLVAAWRERRAKQAPSGEGP
jgi:tellurite resistance protein TerC